MKNKVFRKLTAVIGITSTLLCGCGSSKPVSTSCSGEIEGFTGTITVTAAGEDEPVETIELVLTMQASYLGLSDFSVLGDDMKETMTSILSSTFNISESSIQTEVDDDEIRFTLNINAAEARSLFDISDGDMIYSDVVKQISDDSSMSCD